MDALDDSAFFKAIYGFLHSELDTFGFNLLGGMLAWAGGVAFTLLTLSILIQGYRIATGQSRESMMALVVNALRATFIVGLATGLAFGGSTFYEALGDGLSQDITSIVLAEQADPVEKIDRNLDIMQAALTDIDALPTGDDQGLKDSRDRAMSFLGIGIAGPAVIGGALLLLNKIALALFLGLGPLFVLGLLFDQTKPLFGRWLYYGIGTLFSLAVLSWSVAVAQKLLGVVATAFWVGNPLGMNAEGVTALALMQGGVGLVMTVLVVMTPPIAARFFSEVLGNFTAHSAFGQGPRARTAAGAHPEAARDQTTSTPTHAFRETSTPSQQADEIKRHPNTTQHATGSFLARYPNATASLDGGGGSGDPLPKSLQATAEAHANGHLSVGATTNAPVLTTGLSQRVDEIVSKSPTMRTQLDAALNGPVEWKIVYGPEGQGTYFDRNNTTITIDGLLRDKPYTTAGVLAHELGHLQYADPKPHGRNDMLEWHLKGEGVATLNSIRIRRELAAEGVSIAIPTAKHGVNNLLYEKLYDEAVKTGDFDSAARAIGEIYLDSEITGGGKTYRQHYGGGK